MNENIIHRINELAKKAKSSSLSPEEISERDELRKIYIQNFRKNFKNDILDKIYFIEKDGSKTKLTNED